MYSGKEYFDKRNEKIPTKTRMMKIKCINLYQKKTSRVFIGHADMLEMEKEFLFFRICKFLTKISESF